MNVLLYFVIVYYGIVCIDRSFLTVYVIALLMLRFKNNKCNIRFLTYFLPGCQAHPVGLLVQVVPVKQVKCS